MTGCFYIFVGLSTKLLSRSCKNNDQMTSLTKLVELSHGDTFKLGFPRTRLLSWHRTFTYTLVRSP